ncbi:SH2 domain containing protein [Ectocarpus siliculosus]|uniref:SH2 domain containing protein n=1 Tax=Ectocarpus siliculosus TaxID=2880 RepID=D7FNY4_ECTSI|nr:SH2 domain containing protein [Ectocarpus siliculosus]|eukprot:CBJ30253.1 SH2 domain containing protein [Ectocarpus siliculosus]
MLRESGRQIRFRAEVANIINLSRLLKSGCRMLHFAGQGNDKYLAFESGRDWNCGIMEPLEVASLSNLFQAGGVRTELVFISSCSSEMSGRACVEAGVPHVVAVKHKANVTGGNHDVRIFETLPEGQLVDETHPPTPRPPCKKAVPSYKGLAGLQQVVRLLLDERAACVTITGEPGSGKTERAIQACDYVRERHRFDCFLWADCDKAALNSCSDKSGNPFFALPTCLKDSAWEDPCRLIGLAIGMPQPGPTSEQELHQFIFNNPNTDSGQPFQKVLLVLDNVDSLLERDGDAQDRLVQLLCNLCSIGDGGHLKLLATSEHKLLSGHERFRGGTETVARVEPLETRHASELLMDNLPRNLELTELGLESGGLSLADVLTAVQNHPVLKEVLEIAEGHPGTLVRLAPVLLDGSLDDACRLKEMTTRRVVVAARVMVWRLFEWLLLLGATKVAYNWDLATIGSLSEECRADFRDKSYRRRRYGRPNSNRTAVSSKGELSVTMTLSSSTGAPRSPMILSPMGPAFGDTHDQRNRGDTRFLQRDSSSGGGSGGGGRAGMTSPVRPVPNETVREGPARAHSSSPPARCRNPEWHGPPQPPPHSLLHQQLQDHRRVLAQEAPDDEPESPQMDMEEQRTRDLARAAGVVDRGCRLVWVTATSRMAGGCRQDDGGGSGGGWSSRRGKLVSWECLQESLMEHLREGTKTTRNWDDPIISPHGRVADTPQLEFIRGILRRGQEAVARARWGATGDECPEVDGGCRYDFISVEAFAKFSQWWAPLISTLGIIRNDWARTRPVRVHGFMSRLAAKRLLMQRECGTFLLRFSESKMGALVISFTQPSVSPGRRSLSVKHSLVEVKWGGRCCIQAEKGGMRCYASLHDFVRRIPELKKLYPDIPKEEAFGETPRSPPATASGPGAARRDELVAETESLIKGRMSALEGNRRLACPRTAKGGIIQRELTADIHEKPAAGTTSPRDPSEHPTPHTPGKNPLHWRNGSSGCCLQIHGHN